MSRGRDAISLLDVLDQMYRAAVTEPAAHSDASLAAWAEGALSEREGTARADRTVPRTMRKGARTAAKLRRYWEARLADDPAKEEDWRSRVDQALGGRGWLPGLELARWGLSVEPSEELFAEVQQRFRWAHHRPWREGVHFEDYLAEVARDALG